MSFGDLVQAVNTNGDYNTMSVTVTLGGQASAGSLLVAISTNEIGNLTTPANFTQAVLEQDGGDDSIAIYYKIAAGSETEVICASSESTTIEAAVLEIEGPWEASPLDKTASSAMQTADPGPSGITAETDQNDEVAIAAIAYVDYGAYAEDFIDAWANSFTEVTEVADGYYSLLGVAMKVLSATGAQSTTADWDSSGRTQGVIATFKKAAGGGARRVTIISKLLNIWPLVFLVGLIKNPNIKRREFFNPLKWLKK